MSDTSEEFVVVCPSDDAGAFSSPDEDEPYSTMFEFIDLLPVEKLSQDYKLRLKDFLKGQEITLDDFTKLSEENIRSMLTTSPPIPLGPLFRFINIALDYRRSHAQTPQSQQNPKNEWTSLEIIAWLRKEFRTLAADQINHLENAVREFDITGKDLFHPDGRSQFEANGLIPQNVRSFLLQLSSPPGANIPFIVNPQPATEEKHQYIEQCNTHQPQHQSSPIPIQPPLPANVNRAWYWYNDVHGFIRFEPSTCNQINSAIAQAQGRLVLSQGNFFNKEAPGKYEIIFDQFRPEGPHTQRNTQSLESRAVISHQHDFITSGMNAQLIKNTPRTH